MNRLRRIAGASVIALAVIVGPNRPPRSWLCLIPTTMRRTC